MRTRRLTAARALIATGAAGGLVAAASGGAPASAGERAQAAAAASTINIRTTTTTLSFTGPSTVRAGQPLRIRNLSDPQHHGGHTFTLVAANLLPRTKAAQEQCYTPGRICMTAAKAHRADAEGKPTRALVRAGRPGWEKPFSRTARTGDSWYSEKQGESIQQAVRAKAGTTLRYMCVLHPELQGKIRVTGRTRR